VFDLSIIGHFSIDSIILPKRQKPYTILGGSVVYASLTAKSLDAKVSVISKVGEDFPKAYLWWLDQEGIDLSGVTICSGAKTTRFELKYAENLTDRTLKLISMGAPITEEDLPKSLQARVIYLTPIAHEISYGTAEKARECAEVLSLDPQGLIRCFDENGTVTYDSPMDKRILELVDIYKSSFGEILAITGMSELKSAIRTIHNFGVKTVIVTLGAQGSVLSIEGTIYEIPAYKSEKVVDPTGAGDAFMGGFLAEYLQGKDIFWCACVGSAVASKTVEALGPIFSCDKAEIYQRARTLYEEGSK